MRQFAFDLTASLLFAFLLFSLPLQARAGEGVEIRDNQLYIDGVAQPQLYGAELQYFRLRGGSGRNIPRERVIALWNEALDRMVEAKMNAVSFYIPWDFHEYADGKFDFTGTVDEDGDGRPDYPSRDLVTFFKLIEQHGIHRILVRPGPYINAEWGFLGFGAVPQWFHEAFPQSHMMSSEGLRTKLYDYTDPDFRKYSQRWLSELYRQVLSRFIGPGKPIVFLQLDNETNYMWQSLYNHDYSESARRQYRDFLKSRYGSLVVLNSAHRRSWASWEAVSPPVTPGVDIAEDQDWYRFHDETIHDYLKFVRKTWEDLGVREPQVLFTLAESYNATTNGLLPNYRFRNDPGATGMMTVNLYPKTYDTPEHPLLNQPFKADHDVKAADEASDYYLGHREEWVLGPEIQGGWWRGTPVAPEARKQTYLSTLGHGLKALFIYYFNEGENWGENWARSQVQPLFATLRSQPAYKDMPDELLPEDFWRELQRQVDRQILVGIDARGVLSQSESATSELYFDAPLDGQARPGANFALVKEIGEKVIAPYQDFLASAVEMTDPVCLLKDLSRHVPSEVPGVDSVMMNSTWAGGLVGYLMQAGVNPRILHWGLSPQASVEGCRLIFMQDNGIADPALVRELGVMIRNGATVVNLLGDSLSRALGSGVKGTIAAATTPVQLRFRGQAFQAAATPLFRYDLSADPRCEAILWHAGDVTGYRCTVGQGSLVQLGALFYDAFNADGYAGLLDVRARVSVLDDLLTRVRVTPRIRIAGGGDRVVAFGRMGSNGKGIWVTVRNSRLDLSSFRILVADAKASKHYRVKDLFSGQSSDWLGDDLVKVGFTGRLEAGESTVYFVQALD